MSGRRKKDSGGGHGGEEAWLLPYADMITLLLGLFIVLFALSSIDAKKFDNVSAAFSQTFRGSVLEEPGAITDGATGVLDPDAANMRPKDDISITSEQSTDASKASQERFDAQRKLLAKMSSEVDGPLADKIAISEDSRGLVISVAGDALFPSGSAELKDPAIGQMKVIAARLRAFGAPLAIEGHTDGEPYSGPYGDNWGLSGERALHVLRLFEAEGVPRKNMEYVGRADVEPVVQPKTPHQPIAKNRRVEIHILAPAQSVSDFTPSADRAAKAAREAADAKAVTAAAAAKADHSTSAPEAAPAAHATTTKPAASSSWGGHSKPAEEAAHGDAVGDIVNPIVIASG